MTATLVNDRVKLYINNPTVPLDDNLMEWSYKSQYSQETITNDWQLNYQNSRYAEFTGIIRPEYETGHHPNGFYTFTVGPYTGIFKLIKSEPGGGLGEKEYISNNEQRESEVYFRPEY